MFAPVGAHVVRAPARIKGRATRPVTTLPPLSSAVRAYGGTATASGYSPRLSKESVDALLEKITEKVRRLIEDCERD